MFVEIRKQGKKKKYYLAHSYRKEKKVKKLVRYLGEDLSPEQLKKLKSQAEKLIQARLEQEKQIADPLQTVLAPATLASLKKLEKDLPIKITHFQEKDWARFTELFSYDTNAIEGSTVTLSEVEGILEKNTWPKEKETWEIAETYGVAEAIAFLRKAKEHLSLAMIKQLHALVFKNSKSFAGKLRQHGVEVAVQDRFGNIIHRGAPATKVPYLLKQLISWYGKHKSKYTGLILAIVVHNQFETIHPFQDGNGRVGRLLLNNILLKHHLPPVNIRFTSRQAYYQALQAYQKDGDIKPMLDLLLKEYKYMKSTMKVR